MDTICFERINLSVEMDINRDNHYVPQFYLKNWATNKQIFVRRLLVSDERISEWDRRNVRSTAYIKNLYLRIEDGNECDDFELNFNSRFETPVKPILSKICAEQKLTQKDWMILCDYITAQYVRTPSFYFDFADWGRKEIPKIVDGILNSLSEMIEKPAFKQSFSNNQNLLPLEVSISKKQHDESNSYLEVQTAIGKNYWLFTISNILSDKSPIKATFRSRKWSVVTSPPGIVWPTCDAPVIITEAGQNERLSITSGILGKEKIILFPVSPTKVVIGTQKRVFQWHFIADQFLAKYIKQAIVNNAYMFIYSSIEDSQIIGLRPRIVDKSEFNRLHAELSNWYSMYTQEEAPLLTKNPSVKIKAHEISH